MSYRIPGPGKYVTEPLGQAIVYDIEGGIAYGRFKSKFSTVRSWAPARWNAETGSGQAYECRIVGPYVEPRKPREWWANIYGGSEAVLHKTKTLADEHFGGDNGECAVHVREVLLDE